MSDDHVVYAHHTFVRRIEQIAGIEIDPPHWEACCVACGHVYVTGSSEEDANRWAAEHDAGAPRNELFAGLKPGQTRHFVVDDETERWGWSGE